MSKPIYKIGDVVLAKYNSTFWPDVVLIVEEVSADHGRAGDHRYWGRDNKGQVHRAYETQLTFSASVAPVERCEHCKVAAGPQRTAIILTMTAPTGEWKLCVTCYLKGIRKEPMADPTTLASKKQLKRAASKSKTRSTRVRPGSHD